MRWNLSGSENPQVAHLHVDKQGVVEGCTEEDKCQGGQLLPQRQVHKVAREDANAARSLDLHETATELKLHMSAVSKLSSRMSHMDQRLDSEHAS